ncbi:hypothetical protein TWF696_000829 [Orbilia brochopaga]|uniref:Cyclin-like domain-containing protein n=1 Tax=Orbilia brochopaga TaxID=3140254 RepID=A0AAV9VE31_9PEZI
MDAKPQRKTSRIRDENDPSQLRAAAGRRKMMASTAGSKMAAGPSQRLEQPAKRVALADSTRYDATIANKVPDQAAKGGLSKPAVRGKPLAAKTSTASLATGAAKVQQRSEAHIPASKTVVFRDDGANEAQVFASNGVVQSGMGNASRLQGPRKRPFVYRDDPVPDQAQQVALKNEIPESGSGSTSSGVVAPAVASEEIPDALSGCTSPISATTTAVCASGDTPRISQLPSPESFDPRLDEPVNIPVRVTAAAAPRPSVQVAQVPVPTAAPQDTTQYKTYVPPAVGLRAEDIASFHDPRDITGYEKQNDEIIEPGPGGGRVFPVWNDESRREVERAHWLVGESGLYDSEEIKDPNYVPEYADEILDYMLNLDAHYLADPHYMSGQTAINWEMRVTLIDWLVEVHSRFTFVAETLYNTVNIVDRFLSQKTVPVDKLQLVGIVALFIASKYEEIEQPAIDTLVYMVDNAYTREEILQCEAYMLKVLNWEINAPGPMNFLRYVSTADNFQWDIRALAKYFLESTLMDQRFVGCPMHYTVAACYYLARIMLNECEWVCIFTRSIPSRES